MEGYWSLVIFTILGQASAGMLMLLSPFANRTADDSRTTAWVACILLGAGALASLGHLSDPAVSFYTITNVGTSWLSREILFVGLFGAGLLLWLITLNAWIRWLTSFLGLGLVYVMSRVYTLPTVPFWNTLATFWTSSPRACCSARSPCCSLKRSRSGATTRRAGDCCSAGTPCSSCWRSPSRCSRFPSSSCSPRRRSARR